MKSALLVIDMQRGLFDDTPRPFEADMVVHRINALTDRARRAGVPVAFIQHEDEGALKYQSENWALERHLRVVPGDMRIRKRTPDSFQGTALAEWLTEHGAGRVIVCGYSSEFCVDTTVRRAAALGYEVVLAADAHTSHDKAHASGAQIRAHHNATLSSIRSFGPTISAVDGASLAFSAAS